MSDGSTSAGGGVCDAKPGKQPAPTGQTPLTRDITDFLTFCRIEKGLAANSLEAYSRDLQRYGVYFQSQNAFDVPLNHTDTVLSYLNSLYRSGLGSRSIARHLASLRNFYNFLLREGKVTADPTEHLHTPKQWKNIPKFLNLSQINKLLQAPDAALPTGVRDRALLELLYASGLRVSELCRVGISDLNLDLGVLRTTGKGNKQRLVPVGRPAVAAGPPDLETARGQIPKRRGRRHLFL